MKRTLGSLSDWDGICIDPQVTGTSARSATGLQGG